MNDLPHGSIRTHLFLAESAQVVSNKLYVLGGGIAGQGCAPGAAVSLAICGFIEVPWDQNNKQHALKVELVDGDGAPYMVATPVGDQPLALSANFSSSLNAEFPRGTPNNNAFSVQLNLPVTKPGNYTWRVSVDGIETQTMPYLLSVAANQAGQQPR